MKESWLVYDYVRRWWGLLLLGPALGAVLGLAYYSSQAHPVEYAATATVAIEGPVFENERSPEVVLTIDSSPRRTEEAVVEHVTSTVAKMVAYTKTPVVIREFAVERNATDEVWWKAVLLGSVAGTLLAIAGAYVWDDARAFRRTVYEGI